MTDSHTSPMLTLEQATWAWIEAGPKKYKMDPIARFLKGFMAGIYLSLGGTLVQILTADSWFTTNAPGLLKVIQGAVFPVGLVIIVLLQADLVTGSQAIFIMSTLKRKIPPYAFLIDWALVFIANLCGALFYAGIFVHYSGIYTADMLKGAAAQADTKVVTPNFRQIFLRAIGCNLCVCISLFQASLARDMIGKIVSAWFPIFIFVSCGYDHVVANMFLIPEGLMTGLAHLGVGEYIWKSMVPAFLGNFLGAACLALPMLYIHGKDEFDPARVREQLPFHHGHHPLTHSGNASSDGGEKIGGAPAALGPRLGADVKDPEWVKAVEQQSSAIGG
ncbi:hypothetical protein V8E36_004085 [Tilletia maclaganii]